MLFRQIFDPKLAQYAYLIGCQKTRQAIVIDPERDIDRYLTIAEAENIEIVAVAETHIHADFLSGAREFAERCGTRLYLSDEGGDDWRYEWAKGRRADGAAHDAVLLHDGDTFSVGNIEFTAIHTPGHTPEHLSYLIIDRGGGASTPMSMITGDFVFVGDLGRPDLLEQAAGLHGMQEPAARQLYASLPRFLGQEDHLTVWPGHGAGSSCGKALGAVPVSTIGYEKRYNASLAAAKGGEDEFVRTILGGQPEPQTYFARMKRDNRLGPPILGSLPGPRKLTPAELRRFADPEAGLVIDTRLDRSAFMARHLPGSLYAPMNRTFNTVVGSLVVDEQQPIVLIVDEVRVEEAVRDLIRIGYDNIVAFADPAALDRYFDEGGPAAMIAEVDFSRIDDIRSRDEVEVLDVRYTSEYVAGHVPGAVNASYTRLPDYMERRVPKNGTLAVHCGTGARSAVAAAFLAREGREVVYVNGSFEEYARKREVQEERLAGA
jgi:hydroxyacylglutathione hydrolase